MPAADARFQAAIDAIDAANADDPFTIVIDGRERPKEQAHAELMTGWVHRLDAQATEAQLLAARAHHLRRWALPRADYPDGRAGYLRWRAELKRRHAREVGEILTAVGYPVDVIEHVQRIVQKQGLGTDPTVQVHEDALCLVFLSTQFEPLIERLGPDKAVEVVAKTLRKMSDQAKHEALGLPLSDTEQQVVASALEVA